MHHRHRIHVPLHRRIFLIFTLTIAATAAIGLLLMNLFGGSSSWHREVDHAKTYVAHRFLEAWEDPAARERVALGMATDLDIDVVVQDERGGTLASAGQPCDHPQATIPIERDEQTLGAVLVCMKRHRYASSWTAFAPLLIALGLLWAASGFIARRLLRPLHRLAQAAADVGRGAGKGQAPLPHDERGEVGVLAHVLDDMTARIAQQLADQRALLAAVSHELRTPLARLRLLTEIARDRGADDKTLDGIDREVVEIDALVSDLLASSRLDFSTLSRTKLDASAVVLRALERSDVDPAKLVVEGQSPSFEADPTLIARALANLLDNAKQHAGGVETVRVAERDGAVVLEVEDAGPGFEPGDEERAFEPFYRGARQAEAQAEARSVGLGLALVKRIAAAHGGRATARNRPQGGACVGIELPL